MKSLVILVIILAIVGVLIAVIISGRFYTQTATLSDHSAEPSTPASVKTPVGMLPKELQGDWYHPSGDDMASFYERIHITADDITLYGGTKRRGFTAMGPLKAKFVKQDGADVWIIQVQGVVDAGGTVNGQGVGSAKFDTLLWLKVRYLAKGYVNNFQSVVIPLNHPSITVFQGVLGKSDLSSITADDWTNLCMRGSFLSKEDYDLHNVTLTSKLGPENWY